MMPSVAYGTVTGANGLTLPESPVAPHFDCLDLTGAMLPFTL